LYKANVSKTAYYHLIYKETLLPNSVHAIAETLNVRPSVFLEEASPEEEMIRQIMNLKEKVLKLTRIIKSKEATEREKDRLALLVLRDTLATIEALEKNKESNS